LERRKKCFNVTDRKAETKGESQKNFTGGKIG
jgi:hypothetical protein